MNGHTYKYLSESTSTMDQVKDEQEGIDESDGIFRPKVEVTIYYKYQTCLSTERNSLSTD